MARDFVSQNMAQLARLRTVVARLRPEDMAREIGGGWTIGDELVHLAFYDRRAAILLTRFAREGVTASPYDYETINEALLFLSRVMPPEAIAAEVIAAAEAANAAAEATPDEILPEIERRQEVKLSRAEHRRNHLDAIEAILAR
ncbi:MAG: maleylpyruvate isomerase N-terminal domain-containing protein [Thermomicrobiales bacterium]